MRPISEAGALLVGGAVADFAFRLSQVALPLVVIAQTGSAAATGLAAGVSGLPMLLSPWWARRGRQWVDRGRRLALVALAEAAAVALIPAAATVHRLSVPVLLASGLLTGFAVALSDPGRSALLADVGDRWGGTRATVLLTWQDTVRRTTMLVAPALGAVAVAAHFAIGLLWLESAAVLLAGGAATPVPAASPAVPTRTGAQSAPSIRSVLAGYPEVRRGWVIRGTGCFMWFAFTLGMAVLGVERGRPGTYFAVAMTGYGLGSVLSSVLLLRYVPRLHALRAAGASWAMMGACWVVIGLDPILAVVAVMSALGACFVVLGNACITQLIVRGTSGPQRRSALSGQTVSSARPARSGRWSAVRCSSSVVRRRPWSLPAAPWSSWPARSACGPAEHLGRCRGTVGCPRSRPACEGSCSRSDPEAAVTDGEKPADETRRKFREALDRKKAAQHASEQAVERDGSNKSHRAGGPTKNREFRRKSGG